MQTEAKLRALSERVLQSTLATLPRRVLPISAHTAAEELYDAVDAYAAAINRNDQKAAHVAAQRVAIEAMRVLVGYEMPAAAMKVTNVRVENKNTRQDSRVEV